MSASTDTKAAAPGFVVRHEAVLFIVLMVAVIFLGFWSDKFLTVENTLNQGRLMTEVALVALPMTFIIITGGIDLSVGSAMGLSAIMLGYSWKNFGFPLELSILTAILVGTLCGFFNGLLIVRVKVAPLIMTLATLALFRGAGQGRAADHDARHPGAVSRRGSRSRR